MRRRRGRFDDEYTTPWRLPVAFGFLSCLVMRAFAPEEPGWFGPLLSANAAVLGGTLLRRYLDDRAARWAGVNSSPKRGDSAHQGTGL